MHAGGALVGVEGISISHSEAPSSSLFFANVWSFVFCTAVQQNSEQHKKSGTMEESKSGGAMTGGGGEQEMNEQQIIGVYRGMLGDVNQMRRKIAELEGEVSEHQ